MRYAIGLDIGGTKIQGVLADERGKILLRIRTETQANTSAQNILSRIISVTKKLQKKKLIGVGISIAGFIVDGRMRGCPNIKALEGVRIKRELEKALGLQVIIDNDANCFALAEMMYGAAKGYKNVFGLIVGTGIGGGIIAEGKIYSGAIGAAGEFGHDVLTPGKGLVEGHGIRGTIESYCGGRFLREHYKRFGGKAKINRGGEILKLKDEAAQKTKDQFYHMLGLGLSHVANALNPDIMVVGGGISKTMDLRRLKAQIKKYTIKSSFQTLKLVKNKQGDDAGVYGALSLIFNSYAKV